MVAAGFFLKKRTNAALAVEIRESFGFHIALCASFRKMEQHLLGESDEETVPSEEDDNGCIAAPEPKQHSYLPGTEHPLFPEKMLQERRKSRPKADSKSNGLIVTPILELPAVVVFPGSVLPIRLSHPDWVEYLGRKIDESRIGASNEEVRIGILTLIESPEQTLPWQLQQQERRQSLRQRRSWMRTGISRRRSQRIQQLIDQNMDLFEESTNNDEAGGNDEGNNDEERISRRATNRTNPTEPLIGRIGTLVTVTYTHGDSAFESSNHQNARNQVSRVWQQHNQGDIIMKAVGTGRFKVVHRVDEDSQGIILQRNLGHQLRHQSMPDLKFYAVKELRDEELSSPPLTLLPGSSAFSSPMTLNEPFEPFSADFQRHDHLIHALAQTTHLPEFLLRSCWPWQLILKIRIALERIPSLSGLQETVAMDAHAPTAFAIRMAANLPIKESEKLEVLEMNCTVKRLKYILEKVLSIEQQLTFFCCKRCSSEIAHTSDVFSIAGAEGTNGNYVNNFGVVHQTFTLRSILDECAWYDSQAQTFESWFPGYSWTCMRCASCGSPLGWLFREVKSSREGNDAEPNRPTAFWGLSGSFVTTKVTRRTTA